MVRSPLGAIQPQKDLVVATERQRHASPADAQASVCGDVFGGKRVEPFSDRERPPACDEPRPVRCDQIGSLLEVPSGDHVRNGLRDQTGVREPVTSAAVKFNGRFGLPALELVA